MTRTPPLVGLAAIHDGSFIVLSLSQLTALQAAVRSIKQEGPPFGGAVRNAMSLILQRLSHIMLAITCSENVPALPCIDSHLRRDRDNNTTPVIYVMHGSI